MTVDVKVAAVAIRRCLTCTKSAGADAEKAAAQVCGSRHDRCKELAELLATAHALASRLAICLEVDAHNAAAELAWERAHHTQKGQQQ